MGGNRRSMEHCSITRAVIFLRLTFYKISKYLVSKNGMPGKKHTWPWEHTIFQAHHFSSHGNYPANNIPGTPLFPK